MTDPTPDLYAELLARKLGSTAPHPGEGSHRSPAEPAPVINEVPAEDAPVTVEPTIDPEATVAPEVEPAPEVTPATEELDSAPSPFALSFDDLLTSPAEEAPEPAAKVTEAIAPAVPDFAIQFPTPSFAIQLPDANATEAAADNVEPIAEPVDSAQTTAPAWSVIANAPEADVDVDATPELEPEVVIDVPVETEAPAEQAAPLIAFSTAAATEAEASPEAEAPATPAPAWSLDATTPAPAFTFDALVSAAEPVAEPAAEPTIDAAPETATVDPDPNGIAAAAAAAAAAATAAAAAAAAANPVPIFLVDRAPKRAPVVEPEIAPAVQLVQPVKQSSRKPLAELVDNHPMENWVDGVLRDLVEAGASDVHLDLSGVNRELTLLARRDGDLEHVRTVTGRDATMILNKLKTAADLPTSSSIVPSDGKYPLPIDGYPYRVRAVTLPLFDGGEKIVLRLPSIGRLKTYDELGFSPTNLTATRKLLAKPGGLTLIAGPMGEGKTTTAHATIFDVGVEGRSTIAVEDPVERILPNVHQLEVNEGVGAGFGHIMKFLVRADFDTLFVGEIRDAATAEAAIRMAKAGRRVISTIHATDNVTAVLRLIELSEDTPLSVLDSVHGIISQRLVRKLDGNGGYVGRHPIHEVLEVTDDFTDEVIANKSLGDIRAAAHETSTTFAQTLRELIASGITDQAESRRVIGRDA
ncbi:GspE/PulE family protein [Leifsonia sp. Leaf264]|uniref:GspE/PulE family protein n=1 Tax=Leifsonia sp. Leaf264 TaxID=1736314 RepID=UPI0006F958DE|nr:ATPase, T2SS/T4P/T4SS family [Leifsonia sp. Leaf264]KQO98701.1 hypothetical protein ASF30_11605 [Leifsonia sp. Leaf264]